MLYSNGINHFRSIRGCLEEDVSRKEMLIVYAKGAKGYEPSLKLSQPYINKAYLDKGDDGVDCHHKGRCENRSSSNGQ